MTCSAIEKRISNYYSEEASLDSRLKMACIPKRYILVILAHFASFCMYSLRVNLSVAIVSMVNQTYANAKRTAILECGIVNETTISQVFFWFFLFTFSSNFPQYRLQRDPENLEIWSHALYNSSGTYATKLLLYVWPDY